MKRSVYLHSYASYRSDLESPVYPIQSPLARRFSPIQKGSLEVLERLRHISHEKFDYFLRDLKAPLYFATSLGEVDSVTKVIGGILEKDLPVSPTAFQHSVHNAPAGHVSIFYGMNSCQLTFSSGFLSFDKALFSAAHKIAGGLLETVCVFAADERRSLSGNFTIEAEACFLTCQKPIDSPRAYEVLDYQPFCMEVGDDGPIVYEEEGESLEYCPLRLNEAPASFVRIVRDRSGDGLSSKWRQCL